MPNKEYSGATQGLIMPKTRRTAETMMSQGAPQPSTGRVSRLGFNRYGVPVEKMIGQTSPVIGGRRTIEAQMSQGPAKTDRKISAQASGKADAKNVETGTARYSRYNQARGGWRK
jgi:hypothetical protein